MQRELTFWKQVFLPKFQHNQFSSFQKPIHHILMTHRYFWQYNLNNLAEKRILESVIPAFLIFEFHVKTSVGFIFGSFSPWNDLNLFNHWIHYLENNCWGDTLYSIQCFWYQKLAILVKKIERFYSWYWWD